MSTDVISGTVSKKADRYAIDVLGIPSLTLMETASSKVAAHIISNFPTSSVLVLSGTGNNGAGGIYFFAVRFDVTEQKIDAVFYTHPDDLLHNT